MFTPLFATDVTDNVPPVARAISLSAYAEVQSIQLMGLVNAVFVYALPVSGINSCAVTVAPESLGYFTVLEASMDATVGLYPETSTIDSSGGCGFQGLHDSISNTQGVPGVGGFIVQRNPSVCPGFSGAPGRLGGAALTVKSHWLRDYVPARRIEVKRDVFQFSVL